MKIIGRVALFLCISAIAIPLCAQDEEPYAGPSILTRDRTLAGERGGRLIDFQLYGLITGIYDSGLTAVSTNSTGTSSTRDANYGGELGFGAMGSRRWRTDEVRLDYHGDYRRYTPNSLFDGSDQLLQFDWNHIISRHVQLDFHEVGGIQSLSYGPLAYVPLRNTDLLGVPGNQLFDSRTYFSQSGVNLVWQKSGRLSFSFGGDGFIVRHAASTLAGVSGYRARTDAAYRISKRHTVYASYAYQEYDFQRAFGHSNISMAQLGWSLGIGREWEVSAEAGGASVKSLGLQQVPIDPAIAAIVGQGYTTVTAQRNLFVPVGQLQLTRRFRRSALTASGGVSITPGDGVYLTSRQTSAAVNYSYTGGRHLTASATGAYSKLGTVAQQTLQNFNGFSGGVGLGWHLFSTASLQARFDSYRYDVHTVSSKNENRVTFGIAVSTGERPLAIW